MEFFFNVFVIRIRLFFLKEKIYIIKYGDSHDRIVVGFITTYAISAHHH
jgi:hypothetical protein